MRPFEGIKILDCTHVLAGPFAAYQLGVLGADVIKVDDPNEPDQSRESGADHALNKAMMGTGFLTQGSNKRAIALNLKTEGGRAALKRLVAEWADVLVENYRPGAFKALGLGYEDLARLNPTLVYASMTAFGQDGPRGTQTAYDHAIQATSGITASTGTEASGPIKAGAPMVDYATGTMGAFAISAGSSNACAPARVSTSTSRCSTSP
jgi:crotonobetainyl-CoA:carnitine CoA-transferase CaiB-like acyl-CoA transferase